MTTSSRRWRGARRFVARLRPRTGRHLLARPLQRVLLPDDAAVLHRHRGARASATTAPTPARSTCPRTSPPTVREAVLESGVDVAISASMDVDHGTVQPLQKLFGDADGAAGDPDLHQLGRHPARADAAGPGARRRRRHYLATLGKRVLVVGSGGLSHDPPVPTLATAPPAALDRIVHGEPMTPEQRAGPAGGGDGRRARRSRTATARCSRSTRTGITRSSNCSTPTASPRSTAGRTAGSQQQAGNSAHEIRTWVAAFAALAAHGRYETQQRFYRAAPELIAGFAVRTAVCTP